MKSTLPILSGLLLETRDDQLYCLATDLELGIEVRIPEATIIAPGKVVIQGKTFFEIIRHLSSGRIELFLDDRENLFNIKTSTSFFSLHTLPVDEFPTLPEGFKKFNNIETENEKIEEDQEFALFYINAAIFREAVRQSLYATLPEDPRPFLSSILGEFTEDQLRMVATDINRLVIKEIEVKGKNKRNILIPVKSLREIATIFGNDPDEEIKVIIDQRQLFAVGKGIIISSRLIDSQFPRYEQVIPKEFNGKLRINRQVLLAALNRSSLLDKAVKLSLSEAGLIISSNEPELGMAYEEVICDYQGEKMEIGFNAQYLMDFLKNVNNEEILFSLSSGMKASLMSAVNGEDYRYIIMPLRLSV
jgi:DNA polymerase-3 subunit beta